MQAVDLPALIAIDRARARPEGLRKSEMAEQLGRSPKYVQRYMAVLQSLGAEISMYRCGEYLQRGSYYVHRYTDRRRRVFSRWVHTNDRTRLQ